MSFLNKNILFLNDSSIQNPILHSQGLPLLDYYTRLGIKSCFISFENSSNTQVEQIKIENIKKRFSENIRYYEIRYQTDNFFPNWLLYFFYGIRKVIDVIKKENISIIQTRSLYPAVIGLIIKVFFSSQLKLIYDNRGVFIVEEIYKKHWKENSLKVKLFKYLEKLVIKNSDAIVVVSHSFKDYLIASNKDINISEKIFVISNGTVVNKFSEENNLLYNNTNKKITAVYSGSFADWQKSNTLIKVLKELIEMNIGIKILTYAKNEFFQFLKEKNLDLSKISIEFVNSDRVHSELKKCSFGILVRENNLINNVSSPLKFAEYLNAGLPVLISKGIGDTERLVKEKKVGVVINDSIEEAINKIIGLVREKDIRKRCREIANKFYNIHSSHKKYLEILIKFNEK